MSPKRTDFIEPYDSLIQRGPGLYTLDGDWEGTTFRRRMTVIQLANRALLIHSAIRLRDEDYALLERLGKVQWIILPNAFHVSEAHSYKFRYPDAKLLGSVEAVKAISKQCAADGTLPGTWAKDLQSEVECLLFEGTRMLGEVTLFHRPSRTLILTDIAFNMRTATKGFEKMFFKWNQIDHRFGPSRIFRNLFVRDRAQARASFERMLEWDFDRVIVNHGDVLESGGKSAIQAILQTF